MINRFYIFILLLTIQTGLKAQVEIKNQALKGRLFRYENFHCTGLDSRNIDVWVPSNFDSSGRTRYAVLYMHDGQNLFLPGYSFGGKEWGMDESLDSLLRLGIIKNVIVVGIWNSPKRFIEYNPEDAFARLDSMNRNKIMKERGGSSLANAYLSFVFDELKPFIDTVFPTKPDVKNTYMMGSSMGGLISLYALCKYSDKVRGVACLSTHWPLSLKENNAEVAMFYTRYMAQRLPNPMQHKLYFDRGDATLDAWYAPYQTYMNELCAESGYLGGKEFMSLVFEGAPHNEDAWRARVAIPLKFLLKP